MIGLFGGTFDPIHHGHLRPVFEVFEELRLREVRWIPCRIPPHRQFPVAKPAARAAMVRAAIAPVSGFSVDEREMRRDGPSYTIDTLLELRRERSDASLCLILGMDAFVTLPTWRRWDELLDYAHAIVMYRPGVLAPQEGEMAELIETRRAKSVDDLCASEAGRILFHPVTQLDISASRIRQIVASGRSARFLLPDAVLEIIESEGLYR